MAINCAAIPEALLENELFGHEKGAFTGRHAGARSARRRWPTTARSSWTRSATCPCCCRAKILRLVQEKQFERVGGVQTLSVDVRVVAATNRDLKEAVAAKQFREDLFFRLSVFPVEIPPLRRRRGDILRLADAFLENYAREMGRRGLHLTDAARTGAPAALLAGQRARAAELPGARRPSCATAARSGPSTSAWASRQAADRRSATSWTSRGPCPRSRVAPPPWPRRRRSGGAMQECDGDRNAAAERLGVSLSTLSRRLRAQAGDAAPEEDDS